MKIGKTNAIFGSGGGGVVYNFVPFVAPESFNDPSKYADYGCTVNLHEKFRIYKMMYPGADIAVEFSDAVEKVAFTSSNQITTGTIIEIFETVSGDERSVLRTTTGEHWFTGGSTKRYMIRRGTSETTFSFPIGSVWAYVCGLRMLSADSVNDTYLKYIFFHENTLTDSGFFSNTVIEGVLRINGGITFLENSRFYDCPNLTKVIIGNQLTTIEGHNVSGVFYLCTGLLEADLGTGITSIGTDTFRDCTSLASIICRAFNPPTLAATAFKNIPETAKFYVTHERVNVYKAANGWREFASRIYSINDL